MPQKSSTGTIYNIIGGKINQKVNESTPGAIKRKNKNNVDVWEIRWDSLNGIIKSFTYKDSDQYGRSILVGIDEGDGAICNLSMSIDSKYYHTFVKRIEVIDLSVNVLLKPYDYDDKQGKRRVGVVMYQSGNKIKPKYDKDNPMGNVEPFPSDNTNDKVRMAAYEVSLEKAEELIINGIKLVSSDLPESKPNIEFKDFDDDDTVDDTVPF